MSIALTEEQTMLAEVVASFAADADVAAASRAAIDEPSAVLPPFWKALVAQGWAALAVPEAFGGQGFGLVELAVVVEELARVVAPGPFLPTALAATVIAECGAPDQAARLVPDIVTGAVVYGVGLAGLLGARRAGGGLRLEDGVLQGSAGPVMAADIADRLALVAGDDLVLVDARAEGVRVLPGGDVDLTRRAGLVVCRSVAVAPELVLPGAGGALRRLAWTLGAAEAAGVARGCTDMAVAYALERRQFGRPIGSFQAVKHHCADMLVDTETAGAAAWAAARLGPTDPAAAAVAAAVALPAALRCAQRAIQVHGGIGYTWEHPAHRFFRRATSLLLQLAGEDEAPRAVVQARRRGGSPGRLVELPPEAEVERAAVRRLRQELVGLPDAERRQRLADGGYVLPHLPPPYGRGAGAVEQMVIEEELGDLIDVDLGVGVWVIPTLVEHGTDEQLQRWMGPSLVGELRWCQLFSEPGAGSDAAAIATRGRRVDGGWVVRGQKVWTSDARRCQRGIATVRTDPEAGKHAGVTMMVIDLGAPGVEIRPLREMTGEELFNEVFLDDVFVPDADVLGAPGDGWRVARSTLGNERVTIGAGAKAHRFGEAELLAVLDRHAPEDAGRCRQVGALVAEAEALRALNARRVHQAMAGQPAGAEGNLTKLAAAELAQRTTELGADIAGPRLLVGDEPTLARDLLFTRCLTIAGGTSEVVRTQIAERLLGLPR